MPVNWEEVQKALSPLKDYEDCCDRYRVSFGYTFVREKFNYTMPEMIDYTQRLLLGDSRNRYIEYNAKLVAIFARLEQAGVKDVLDLAARTASHEHLEAFIVESDLSPTEVVTVKKFMVYWFIPNPKYLGSLVRNSPETSAAVKDLGEIGVRTNLDMLEKGINASGRETLGKESGLPPEMISELVNRADLSRMPWASKATISNIIGAGYPSLAALANADPNFLYQDFFSYGKKIGKNLKLGNEIENSYRIAKIVPVLLDNE